MTSVAEMSLIKKNLEAVRASKVRRKHRIRTTWRSEKVFEVGMRRLALTAIGMHVLLALIGCGPSEKQKAALAEQRRIECLDKICEGDVVPKRDPMKEEVLKLNGQWFIGPKNYFSSGSGMSGAAFFWSSKTPARPNTPDFPEKAVATSGRADEVTIEIFLRSNNSPPHGPSRYKALQIAESQGRVLGKTELKSGLEAWRVQDGIKGLPPAIWYVAKSLKGADGEPPVLGCDDQNPKFDRCTMAFFWQPGIAVDLRFRARHGPDWPDISRSNSRTTTPQEGMTHAHFDQRRTCHADL